jgi:hypothetical protein
MKKTFLSVLILVNYYLLIAQTMKSPIIIQESDIAICEVGKKITLGKNDKNGFTAFDWLPISALDTPDKPTMIVSPTQTTTYTRIATKVVSGDTITEKRTTNVIVLKNNSREMFMYLLAQGFKPQEGTNCITKDDNEVTNLDSSRVFDYANLQVQFVVSGSIMGKGGIVNKTPIKAKDILQNLQAFLVTKGITSIGLITKNSNICDGSFFDAQSKYDTQLDKSNENFNTWFHFCDFVDGDVQMAILFIKSNQSEEFKKITREFGQKNLSNSFRD